MLLDRLRADCDYFLGAGGRSEKHLWAGNVHAQVKKMRELYDALPEKPEWLTAEAIDRYAAQMAAPYQVAAYHLTGTLGQRSETQKQSKSCFCLGNAYQPFKRLSVLCRLRKKNDLADALQ